MLKGDRMRLAGWIFLIGAFVFYADNPTSMAGRFLNGVALGCFLTVLYEDYKKKKQK